MCSFHTNKGQEPPKHDCRKNWLGSSKAMESSVAVDMIKEVEEQSAEVSVLIIDDHTTTMARIRQSISHPVHKWSDLNHTKHTLEIVCMHCKKSTKTSPTNGTIYSEMF